MAIMLKIGHVANEKWFFDHTSASKQDIPSLVTLRQPSPKPVPKPWVLHFCILHDTPWTPLTGPQGLIQSFMTQLLHTDWSFDWEFINTRSYKDDIVSHSVKALCFTFW